MITTLNSTEQTNRVNRLVFEAENAADELFLTYLKRVFETADGEGSAYITATWIDISGEKQSKDYVPGPLKNIDN